MKSSKYYVVWLGAKPGVYATWSECQAQISGFPGARYQAFPSLEAAKAAYAAGPPSMPAKKAPGIRKPSKPSKPVGAFLPVSISVDAACSGNPGPMEYQGVYTQTGDRLFHQQFPLGTNNIGEFLAIVHGLAYLHQRGQHQTPIYSDSVNALKWVRTKKCKTQLKEDHRTKALFEMIHRAEAWLETHTYSNPLLKWETEAWGEIPADFGRK
ncbi:MAG: ribonuclease H family protein [Haliscomenobacter sp.]|nr:ribonuclease H family protein [Haliscomenobacter sp.]